MRTDDPDLLAEVTSTTVGDELVAVAWRGDSEKTITLAVIGWQVEWDADRQVQGQATVEVADPDGTLAPWGASDILAPFGSRVALWWRSGRTGRVLPWGQWRIRRSVPSEQWRLYTVGSTLVRVPGGGAVTLYLDEDLTATAQLNALDAVPGPSQGSCRAEVEHLLDGIGPVTWDASLPDVPVPALTYRTARMDAVQAVLDVVGAVHRIAPDGALHVMRTGGAPVWEITGGDGGALIQVDRELTDEDAYNGVVSTGQDGDGAPIVARSYITTGPLAWGGPFGRALREHTSTATTLTGVQADAAAVRDAQQNQAEITLPVECLTNPALQVHDQVTVVAASLAGDEPLTGRVRRVRMVSTGSEAGITPAKRMQVEVTVPVAALEAVAARVSRARS